MSQTVSTAELLKIGFSDVQRGHIAACIAAGTLYVPKTGGAVTVSKEFKEQMLKSGVETVRLLEVGAISVTGRNDRSGLPTSDSVYKIECKVQAGQLQTSIRLHLCDVVALINSENNETKFSFSEYQGYLVPSAHNRATASEIAEYLKSV